MRRPALPPNVVALGVVSLLNDISSEMIFPLLPAFLTVVVGASPAFLGVVEGAADTVSSLLRLPTGWLSDRVRRKPLVVAGYAIANFARPLFAWASAPWHVLVIRVLDRLGKGIRTAPRDALLADSTTADGRGRAFGFHQSMDHVGAVIGPLLATVLFVALGRSYAALFLCASVPGLVVVAFATHGVQEVTPSSRSVVASTAASDGPPLGGRFVALMVAIVLFGLGNSTDAFLLLGLQQAGVDVALLPLLWAAFHVVKTLSAYPFGGLSDRVGRAPVILAGWAVYAAVYLGFAVAGSAVAACALFLVYGLYYGLTEGAERALVADLVPAERRGLAFGIYNAAVGVTALPASAVCGLLWQSHGRAAAFGFGAAMAALAAIVLAALSSPARR